MKPPEDIFAAVSIPARRGSTLDPTGNQTAVDYFSSFGSNAFSWLNWYQNTANTVNEYTTRKSRGNSGKGRLWDTFTANTAANYSSPGSSVTFTVSTTAHTLTVNTIGRDTIDGYLEPQAQALILTGQNIGPAIPGVTFTIPTGTTSGEVGFVFGYKSGADYWLWASDLSATKNLYHVVNGISTLVATVSYPAPIPGAATPGGYVGGWSFLETAPPNAFGSAGFPSGKIGFYTTIAGVTFSAFSSAEAAPVHLNGRWINDSAYSVNLTAGNGLTLPTGGGTLYNNILLENLRLKKFQATFALTRGTGQTRSLIGFVFNHADRGNFDFVWLDHASTVLNPVVYAVTPTTAPTIASGGSNPTNIPICAATDTLWCRVQNDGTTLTVKAINSATAPSETTWSSTTACYSNASLSNIGGQIGFNSTNGQGYVNNFTLKSYDSATSAFDITEHWDNFTVDGSGYANETLTYDPAGNLTYDGQQIYTYDAWNRLMTIAHAYRDSAGTLQHGQIFDTIAYDGRNRRIQKTVANTGQWDCNYHYYFTNNWQLIETRNGSSQTLKQHVWGIRYIDELIQVAANSNPSTGNTCSGWFYAMQDANFNVLGLVNTSGALVERYEYTPYGERKVLFAAGNTWAGGTSTNDPGCYAIAYASLRYTSNAQYFGLCDIGHQGLMHDEEGRLSYNRRRYGRGAKFVERDRAYVDGPNLYEYLRSSPLTYVDTFGGDAERVGGTQVGLPTGGIIPGLGTVQVYKNARVRLGKNIIPDSYIWVELDSTTRCDCRWLQYVYTYFYKNGKVIPSSPVNIAAQGMKPYWSPVETWIVDADPWAGQPFQNTTTNGNNRAFYDAPTIQLGPQFDGIVLLFDDYLICDGMVAYHLHWRRWADTHHAARYDDIYGDVPFPWALPSYLGKPILFGGYFGESSEQGQAYYYNPISPIFQP